MSSRDWSLSFRPFSLGCLFCSRLLNCPRFRNWKLETGNSEFETHGAVNGNGEPAKDLLFTLPFTLYPSPFTFCHLPFAICLLLSCPPFEAARCSGPNAVRPYGLSNGRGPDLPRHLMFCCFSWSIGPPLTAKRFITKLLRSFIRSESVGSLGLKNSKPGRSP